LADFKLEPGQTIAVVGLSAKPDRPSYDVAQAMRRAGFRIVPVNPQYAGSEILGERCVASLLDIDEAVHVVDCFRKSQDMPDVARDIVAMKRKPTLLWMQRGIESREAREMVKAIGIEVVEDRCIKVDYFSGLA
jgi:uncharacterized protein